MNTGDQVTLASISKAVAQALVGDFDITRTGATSFTIDDFDGTGGSYTGGTYYQASWPTIGGNTSSGDGSSNNEILVGKPSKADNVIVWTTYGWKTYFYYNNKWQTYGTWSSQDFTTIYPDEGLVLVRRYDTDSYALTLSGVVPAIKSSLPPSRGQQIFVEQSLPCCNRAYRSWSA